MANVSDEQRQARRHSGDGRHTWALDERGIARSLANRPILGRLRVMSVVAKDTLLHLNDMQRASRLAADTRTKRLLDRLPQAQEILVTRFQARRVWLFGSLATNTATETSDVDLAVERLPESSYFTALATLMELFGGPVDLVRIETANESLRNRIEQEGRVL